MVVEKNSDKIKKLEEELANSRSAVSALKEELNSYRAVVDQASDLIHSVTAEGQFLYVNETWKEVLGYNDDDIASLRLMDIVDSQCVGKCQQIFHSLLQGEKIDRNRTTFLSKEGGRVEVEGRCRTHFEDGQPVMMTGIFRDLSSETRHAEELEASEMRYQDLFENAHDLIQIVRPDGRLLYVNRSWRETFGYSPEEVEQGLSIFDLIAGDCQGHCQEVFGQVISSEQVHSIQTTFITKTGKPVIIEGNAKCKYDSDGPVYTQCIFHDVTEKRKMEEELIKAQKLESIGVFAGGIAHDFNNLLTAILGNISMAKTSLTKDHPAWIRLDRTERASQRAQGLTQQLLTFSKGGAPIRKTTSLNELLEDSVGFTLRGSSIRVYYELAPDLWPAKVDQGQLSQVAQNLALNASDAMTDGGVFTVKSENMNLEKGKNPSTLKPGRYVLLTFQDNGDGIPSEYLPKVFDPYFSGKKTGSGLGLAISYSVISQHDGLITVDSTVGQGATFHIYLPADDGGELRTELVQIDELQPLTTRILFMDDDEIVIEVAGSMLSALGCKVEIARDGKEAIELYQAAMQSDTPYDGVIMDLTIPGGMGGKEAIARLREIDPQVKAIVSSGYATDPIMGQYEKFGFVGVVPKPYNLEQLRQTLSLLENG